MFLHIKVEELEEQNYNMIDNVLNNGAEKAKYVIEQADPYFKSKEEYIDMLESIYSDKDAVIYGDDGKVTLDI